jgi:hypothetical protein
MPRNPRIAPSPRTSRGRLININATEQNPNKGITGIFPIARGILNPF